MIEAIKKICRIQDCSGIHHEFKYTDEDDLRIGLSDSGNVRIIIGDDKFLAFFKAPISVTCSTLDK